MSNSDSPKLHIAMFPWFAFGHFIPFLHLSNKLAERGHKVSFLLPKGVHTKLEQRNHYPHSIQFFPLVLPHVDGLPPGAESTSDVPDPEIQKYLATALDGTRDQVEAILRDSKPDLVFYDFGYWIPAFARQIGIKSIFYAVVSPMILGLSSKKIAKDMSVEELIEVPPGFPSSTVRIKAEEVAVLQLYMVEDFGTGLSFLDRLTTCKKEGDAIAFRTYREIEGAFCDYVAQRYGKPILLSGPCLPETQSTDQLEEKWANWLSNFDPGSVVFCSVGTQSKLGKAEFQELVLGLELTGLPFLVALSPPKGCTSIEEALPEGFEERVQGRGLVHGGWVPQDLLLSHPTIGCFVNHCGYGTMWESLLSDCQIVLIPEISDQILNTRLMVEELQVAVEVERGENRQISKESLSEAVMLVMDKGNGIAGPLQRNHAKLKKVLSSRNLQEDYINNFIKDLQDLVK